MIYRMTGVMWSRLIATRQANGYFIIITINIIIIIVFTEGLSHWPMVWLLNLSYLLGFCV